MTRRVVVDWSPESPARYRDEGWSVVVVDVIRASTTAVTAVSAGHRCHPVASIEDAHRAAAHLPNAILAGEVEGKAPPGFHMQNSPTEMSRLATLDGPRNLVLLSTSGTTMMINAMECRSAYVACLRNVTAQARHLAAQSSDVAVLGAGSGGVFRPEDQLCCALIAQALADRGFVPTADTKSFLERWRGAPVDGFLESDSVDYLRRTNQMSDLQFILAHVDDLDEVFTLSKGEVIRVDPPGATRSATALG